MLSIAMRIAYRSPFYYGWVIAGVVGLIALAGVAASPAILGLFFKDMENEFGWSRSLISGSIFAGTLLIIPAAPLSGRLVDLYGPRPIVVVGGTVVALCLFGLSYTDSVFSFYALLSVAFGVNAGITRVAINAVVAQWFVRYRGRAMAVMSMFLGLGFVTMPILAALVIDEWGWRAGWRALALAAFAASVPASQLLLRRQPADVGQAVDGRSTVPSVATAGTWDHDDDEVQWTSKEAVRTAAFWVVLGSLSTIALAILGLAVHVIPHLVDQGIALKFAALTFSFAGVTMIPSSLMWGWFLDRFAARTAFLAASVLVILFTLLTMMARSEWMVVPLGVTMGLGFGGFGMVQRIIYANYFGRQSAGTILGLAVPFIAIAQGVGTLVAGAAYDLFDGYTQVFLLFTGLVVLSMGLMYIVRKPMKLAIVQPSVAG